MKEKIIIKRGDYVKLNKEEPLTFDRVRFNYHDTFEALQISGDCIVKARNTSTNEIFQGTWAWARFSLTKYVEQIYEIF